MEKTCHIFEDYLVQRLQILAKKCEKIGTVKRQTQEKQTI